MDTTLALEPGFVLGRLLLFRGLYYGVPLALAVIALGWYELQTHYPPFQAGGHLETSGSLPSDPDQNQGCNGQ